MQISGERDEDREIGMCVKCKVQRSCRVTSVIDKDHSFGNPDRGRGKRRIGWCVKVYIGCLCSCPQMPQLRQSKSGNYRSLFDGRKLVQALPEVKGI